MLKMVEDHDKMLRGNGSQDGLLSSVRQLIVDMQQRKRLQQTILIGVLGLLAERVLNYIGMLK